MADQGIPLIRELVKDDFAAVNHLIERRLYSEIGLISEIAQHITHSGGKRLRPLLVLLSAKCLNISNRESIEAAAIIEFIHTATLLHDDVVDMSQLRRGQNTANAIWGNSASILVGDFLYSRAFQMMANLRQMRVMEILADTTNAIAEGEVLQLMNRHNPQITETDYRNVIRFKTAKLFEAATQLGAVTANASSEIEIAMATYGLHLGLAYQMIDDALDYSGDTEALGKNLGDDLAEGKLTLPLIRAMQHTSIEETAAIHNAIREGKLENLSIILKIIHKTDALDYVKNAAQEEADKAIDALKIIPNSIYKEALSHLAKFAVEREY